MSAVEIGVVSVFLDDALKKGRPEDVFGTENPRAVYRRLARVTHPDHNGDSVAATDAFRKLNQLWKIAVELTKTGMYGKKRSMPITAAGFLIYDRIGRDDVADRFLVRWGIDQAGYARVVRKPRDNDLMRVEANVLGVLATDPVTERYQPFLPKLVKSVALKQTGGVVRHMNVFENPTGDWYSLADVIERYPKGIDPRDMAWMWRRLLMILGAVHRADAIHGAVLPTSVLIEPTLHGLILSNWSFSVPRGGRVPAISPAYRRWYAPEILAKEKAGRGSDVLLAARTMMALVDPGPRSPFESVIAESASFVIPETLPRTLRAFFRACFLDARRRPRDAWELLEDFDGVLERTYGPRRFRPFSM